MRRKPEEQEAEDRAARRLTIATWAAGMLAVLVGVLVPGAPVEEVREILIWIGGILVGGSTAAYDLRPRDPIDPPGPARVPPSPS